MNPLLSKAATALFAALVIALLNVLYNVVAPRIGFSPMPLWLAVASWLLTTFQLLRSRSRQPPNASQ